jgi:pimeloyl-ACP methyl ester carboxylesterase
MFTCSDLCELNETVGQMTIRGLNLTYFIFETVGSHDKTDEAPPLITLHGGPAAAHDYMLPLKQQACRGRRVVFYGMISVFSKYFFFLRNE